MTTDSTNEDFDRVYEISPSLMRWPGAVDIDGIDHGWVDFRQFRAWVGDTIRVKWGPLAGLEAQITGKTWSAPTGCEDCVLQPCYKVRHPESGREVNIGWSQFVVLGGAVTEKVPKWEPDGPPPDPVTVAEKFVSRLLSQNRPGHWHR